MPIRAGANQYSYLGATVGTPTVGQRRGARRSSTARGTGGEEATAGGGGDDLEAGPGATDNPLGPPAAALRVVQAARGGNVGVGVGRADV